MACIYLTRRRRFTTWRLGFKIEQITDIGRQIHVDPERRLEFQGRLETEGTVKHFEYRSYRKDGEMIWTQIDARLVKDSQGRVLYYEGMVQDISERKRREAELRQQLADLKVEIDQGKRQQDVAQLTQSNFFLEVQQEIEAIDLESFWR
ncbi:MAG: PAS domain S-box protein [Cyanobacteriota bacterium]